MLLKVLLITVTAFIVGVAILGYHPLPDGIADPYTTQLVMGFMMFIRHARDVRQLLGYGGGRYQDVKFTFTKSTQGGAPTSASYTDLKVTRDKIAGVPVILYQPKEISKLYPAIVYFHGGGWVLGSADLYDTSVYEYANQTGTVIVNVDYRLAPDHPFPAPVQDCLDVTRYVLKHGDKYNIDVTKVGVAGDSAGGNLAAAVALRISREKSNLPPLLFQVLHYPALQVFDTHLLSFIDLNQTLPILTQDMMCAMYAYYMGAGKEDIDHYTAVISQNRHIPAHLRKSKYAEFVDVKLLPAQYQNPSKPIPTVPAGHDEKVYTRIKDVVTNPLFSPLMSPDLTGLPPAFIYIAEFDVLRDDAFLYARRLQDAGVKVKVHFGKGGYHGDISIASSKYLYATSGSAAISATYAFIKGLLEQ